MEKRRLQVALDGISSTCWQMQEGTVYVDKIVDMTFTAYEYGKRNLRVLREGKYKMCA